MVKVLEVLFEVFFVRLLQGKFVLTKAVEIFPVLLTQLEMVPLGEEKKGRVQDI